MKISQLKNNFSQCIGNTPIIKLQIASEISGCEIYGKCEFLNPGGSVKDRPALQIIQDAIKEKKIEIGFIGKKIIDDDISSISLFKENLVLAINKNNILVKKKEISIKDIKNENFILFPKSKGALGIYDKIIEFCKKANFEPKVIQEAYERLGVSSKGGYDLITARRSLNLLMI